MKKILLACFMALGIGASAQVLLHESFESGSTTYPGFTTTNLSNYTLTGSGCEATLGKQALGRAMSSTATTAVMEYNSGAVTSNGKKIDVSVNFQQWGTSLGGNIKLEYAIGASTAFVAVPGSSTINFTVRQDCMVIAGTIPEGTVAAGDAIKVRVTTTRTAGTFTALYDAIDIVQEVTAIPACTTFTSPLNGATQVSVRPALNWSAAAGAEYYKIKVGTASGLSDVLDKQVTGTSYIPAILNVLPASTLLYASITPTNAMGDATGCASEISFTTGANPFAPYCGPILSSVPASTFPISSVTLAGITNTSSAATGAPAHENFTSTIFELAPNSANAISIVGTGSGTNRFATVVFIDWNNNGSFEDAGEKYFTASPFLYGFTATNTLNGSIAVPANALLDTNLRMRIKYNYVGAANPTSLPSFLTDPCADLGNGQAEDYTVIVKTPTAPPACTTFTAPVDLSTNFASNGTLTWAPSSGATGYKLYLGTASGSGDVLNGTVVTTTSYPVSLTPFTMYYATVVAYNNIGEATGCTEISFTTANVAYCTAGATSASFEKISRVVFAGIDNASTSTAGYEDFTALTPAIVQRDGMYPIVVDNSDFDSDTTSVWIDYNQDGVFDDATEKVTLVPGASATGEITIPSTAKLGNTRMRVKMYYGTTNPTACGTFTYGQVEDYTVTINASGMATASVNKSNVSVYPNPFQDVLKISDVKGVKSITVSDVSGRQVKNMKVAAELNLSDLKTGLYIVTLHMEDGTVKSVKAIKK